MRRSLLLVIAGCLSIPALAQQPIDWRRAKVIHYQVTGVYSARTLIAYREEGGQATVTDTTTLDFDWDLEKGKLVGAVKITNNPSVLKELRNVEKSCPPPSPKGPYEHFEVQSVKDAGEGDLVLMGLRSYPEVQVTAYCQGSWAKKTTKAHQEQVKETLPVLDPDGIYMPPIADSPIRATPDKKSFIVKLEGWTWTYTPSLISGRK